MLEPKAGISLRENARVPLLVAWFLARVFPLDASAIWNPSRPLRMVLVHREEVSVRPVGE